MASLRLRPPDRPVPGRVRPASSGSAAAGQGVGRACACGGGCPRCAAPGLPRAPARHALERQAENRARQLVAQAPGDLAAKLPPQLPARLEPAAAQRWLGRPLGPVHLREDDAANRALGSRAHAVGHELAFAAGAYRPKQADGLALLAHELAHVEQVARGEVPRAGLVLRSGEPAEMEAADALPAVGLAVTTDTEESAPYWAIQHQPSQQADLTGQPLYPGDLVVLHFAGGDGKPLEANVTLPHALLEPLGALQGSAIAFRVQADASLPGATHTVAMLLTLGPQALPMQVVLQVQPTPSRPQVVPAALAQAGDDRAALRERRRAAREAPREQRAGLREQVREDARDQRAQRREARAGLGSCSLAQLHTVEAAVTRAAAVAGRALGSLQAAPPGPEATQALQKYLRSADEASATLAADTLATARNSLLTAGSVQFDCAATACDETTGAYVQQTSRGGVVSLCPMWLGTTNTQPAFTLAPTLDEARAYALLHEFVHLSGPSAGSDSELYVDSGAWAGLGPDVARRQADSFAALAWTLGR